MKKIYLLVLIVITITKLSLSQSIHFITAGETSSSDTSVEIIYINPADTIITANKGTWMGSHYDLYGTFSFDLNNDNIYDYFFRVTENGTTAYSDRKSRILSINNNYFNISTKDTVTVNILNFGDTINNNLLWDNDTIVWPKSYLSGYSAGWQQPTLITGLWYQQADKYVGLKLMTNLDTLFGWIRISVPDYSKIIVKDFAVKIKAKNTSGISTFQKNKIKIFPNPAHDYLTIETAFANKKNNELIISDVFGNEIMNQKIFNSRTIINIKHVKPGIYFVSLKDDTTTKILKLVKK